MCWWSGEEWKFKGNWRDGCWLVFGESSLLVQRPAVCQVLPIIAFDLDYCLLLAGLARLILGSDAKVIGAGEKKFDTLAISDWAIDSKTA